MDIDKNIYLNIDSFRMSQVFSNLITNAIHASSKSGTICIKAFEENDSVTIKIIDYGKGLSKEQIRKLFGKFVALERDLDKFSTFEKGSGLGLYIAKGIIEAHSGKIWVESEGLENGATFNISLPKLS
jgi:signal transduction histidine kinase